uniref:Uncharacterized protein n=1 Tax=Timema douglasi TaxID=61478 RepID=A0A7R8Z7J5_TIMDO|nr:unnamed protein product [Timema douglasi]
MLRLTAEDGEIELVPSFLNDKLIKGDKLTRGRDYEEQREFKIADVFLKFYFVTRCYNQTIEDLVTNIKEGKVPVPDVIIMNSCLWDVSRSRGSLWERIRENNGKGDIVTSHPPLPASPLDTILYLVTHYHLLLFIMRCCPQQSVGSSRASRGYIDNGLPCLRANRPVSLSCLTLSLHIGSNTDAKSNVLIGQESAPKPPPPLKHHTCKPQVDFLKHTLRFEVMEANLYARDVVATHGYDIVDLHYYLSMQLERRANDGIHWLAVAVRFMTNILLTHITLSWDRPLPGNITCSLLDDVVNMTDKSSVADVELPQVPLALRSDELTTDTKTAVVNKQAQTPVRKSSNKKSKKRNAKRNASPKLKIQEIQHPNINPWVQNSFLRNPSAYVKEYLNGVNSYVQSSKVSLRNPTVSGYLNDVSQNYQFGNIAPIEYDKYGMPFSRPSYYPNQPSSYSHRSDNRHSRRPKPY